MHQTLCCALVVVLLHFGQPAHAQSPTPLDYLPALKGDYFAVESTALHRKLHVYVRLPEDYQATRTLYPVVFVTDGDSLFPILAAYHLFLHLDEPVPDAIVVGIAYGTFDPERGNYRAIDYTAPSPKNSDSRAGAAAYQTFLKAELIPEIERRYRADSRRRILVGQSRGGQFVLYSALTDPDLFWARIANNPSLGPNRAVFFQPPSEATRKDLKLFVAGGSRDARATKADTSEWQEFWKKQPDIPWRLEVKTMDGETHAAGITNAYRAGMVWIFGTQD